MSEPTISDEDAELLARRAWRRRHSVTWESGADEDRQEFLHVARLDLAALVASGYRRDADVLREAAEEIRNADSFNYGDEDPEDWQAIVAAHLEMRANIRERYRATALEQAQPLPVADGSEAADTAWAANQKRFYEDWQRAIDAGEAPDPRPSFSAGTPKTEGQERSEEQRHD